MTTNEKALQLHEEWNGKLETISKTPVNTREALALAYTPGVAEPCKVIAQDREAVYKYTMKANTVAVVSEIGRASCRERGLRLVSIWVFSVSLKKNKKTDY